MSEAEYNYKSGKFQFVKDYFLIVSSDKKKFCFLAVLITQQIIFGKQKKTITSHFCKLKLFTCFLKTVPEQAVYKIPVRFFYRHN